MCYFKPDKQYIIHSCNSQCVKPDIQCNCNSQGVKPDIQCNTRSDVTFNIHNMRCINLEIQHFIYLVHVTSTVTYNVIHVLHSVSKLTYNVIHDLTTVYHKLHTLGQSWRHCTRDTCGTKVTSVFVFYNSILKTDPSGDLCGTGGVICSGHLRYQCR